ncbi:MAG: GDSL-type esterase/lipase family protein [Bacteroidota bacterium]|nr:GDSL-type esterase/lipase family protein [Bacteroidota bacterium]
MKNLNITIIGNSVALRVRPPKQYPDNKNYTKLLEKELSTQLPSHNIRLINKAIGALTTYDVIQKIDEYINTFPEFYIINLGVVDASTREIPKWLNQWINSKKENFILFLVHAFYNHLIKRYRSFFVKLRGKKSWISKKKIKKYFSELVQTLTKETNAKIIVIPINPANQRVEKQLPGSLKKHLEYNKIIEKIIKDYSHEFLNTDFLKHEIHYPDGVHYSYEGHQIIAKEISKIILKYIR